MNANWRNTDPRLYALDCNRDFMTIVIYRSVSSDAAIGEVYTGCGFDGPQWSIWTEFKNEGKSVGIAADQEWDEDWLWTLTP